MARAKLAEDGITLFTSLVDHVSAELYSQAIRDGAWAIDIGLFGSALFASEVARDLQAANGVLWRIEEPDGPP